MDTKKKMIHRAYNVRDQQWYVSVDGDRWLGCSVEPTPEDYDEIASWFQPVKTETGMFLKMTLGRRGLEASWGAGAIILDPIAI